MSAVDITKPGAISAYSADVRDNFAIIKDELEAFSSTSSPLEGDGLVGVKLEATGATARTQHDKNEDWTSLFDFYSTAQKVAIRAGTPTDVTAAVLLAVADAEATGRGIRINPGPHVLSSAITFTKAVNLIGDGFYSRFLVDSAVGSSTDILKIVPTSGCRLFNWRNFRIAAVSGTPGRHAIHIDLSAAGAFVANSVFDHLWLDALGGKAFNLTNPTNSNGFFTSTLRNSYIANGVYLQRAGDSLNFIENTLTGANAGLDISVVSGAGEIVIARNNITAAGGAIVLHSSFRTIIDSNNIEQNVAYTGSNQACVSLLGDDTRLDSVDIKGNTMNTGGHVTYCIDVQVASNTHIRENTLAHSGGGHINIGSSSTICSVYQSNIYGSTATITDAGAQTFGPYITVSSFSNSWALYDGTNSPVRYSRDESGNIKLEGAVKDGTTTAGTTIFTLPVGFRPSKAVYFAVAGNNSGTWEQSTVLVTAAGNVQIMDGAATFLGFGGITFKAAP